MEKILQHIEYEIDWLVNWHNKHLTNEEYNRMLKLLEYIQARLYKLKKQRDYGGFENDQN